MPVAQSVTPNNGKDLQDLLKVSRRPVMAFLQKQFMPRGPRDKAPAGGFRRLALLLSSDLVNWVVQYVRYRFGRKHPFLSYQNPGADNGIYRMTGDRADEPIRIALAGDWGTGTDEAFTVAERIRAFSPHYAIHLGDIYFVGDPKEVRENFLGLPDPHHSYTPCEWPQGSQGSFALNGNHEMYARGLGYFDLILPRLGLRQNGRPVGQQASFFCLETDHWRIIGLDTGYHSIGLPVLEMIWQPDCALPDEILVWLGDTLHQATDPRGVILLSHHQYYSRFDVNYPKPAQQLAAFIHRPVLWFWGHEHRLAIYQRYQLDRGITALGRCIGHGGMPVDLPPDTARYPDCAVEFLDPRIYASDENIRVGVNGFARLTLAGADLAIDYVDVHGLVVFTEAWTVDAGGQITRRSATSSS